MKWRDRERERERERKRERERTQLSKTVRLGRERRRRIDRNETSGDKWKKERDEETGRDAKR